MQGSAKEMGVLGSMRVYAVAASMLAVLSLAGCRQDMHDQPKFVPQRGTEFYADGRSARPQVENTVARGQLHSDNYFYTGIVDGKEGDTIPFKVTFDVMARGQERYNIYCAPCHSRVGNGVGMIVERGYRPAGNFNTPRLRAAPLGYYFDVITNGYGAMPDYSAQITPEDRWAIVAYVRALQLSQNATQADVAPGATVEPLSKIAEKEGLPAEFAKDWELPATVIYGTPNGQDNGIPGQGMQPLATTLSKASSGPKTAAPAATKPTAGTAPAETTGTKQ